jgi:hypothetical protein
MAEFSRFPLDLGRPVVPIYTFYPRMIDGSALMFDAVELADDQAAIGHCRLVLAEHRSAAEVVVWEGERHVHGVNRLAPPRDSVRPDGDQAEA